MSTGNELKAICEHFGIERFGVAYPDPRTDNDAAVKLAERLHIIFWFSERRQQWRYELDNGFTGSADSFGEAVYSAAKTITERANE